MNRFSRAGLLLSLSIIIVCIVAFLKGSTSGYIPIVLVLTIIIIIPVSIGMAIGNSIRKKTDASFRKTLDPLFPRYMTFYGRFYAAAEYKGCSISFTTAAKSSYRYELTPVRRYSMILVRVKIPSTAGIKLHLAVVHHGNGAVRKMLGWTTPEDGFFIAGIKNQTEAESLSLFMRLSASTKAGMKNLAEQCGSCGVTPDWESVMIGKENSLKLHGGDHAVIEQLDFQSWIQADITETELIARMDEIVKTVKLISCDLK